MFRIRKNAKKFSELKAWMFCRHKATSLVIRQLLMQTSEFNKAFPLMMTSAGTVAPAKILVIGAGVAGLQAIATAKGWVQLFSHSTLGVRLKNKLKVSVRNSLKSKTKIQEKPLLDMQKRCLNLIKKNKVYF